MARRFENAWAGMLGGLWLAASASPSWAQGGDEVFSRSGGSDLAVSWLRALFRGVPLGGQENAGPMGLLTHAIAQVLKLYSVGILAIAGLLLLYYVAIAIAETAHTGKFRLGGSGGKAWVPLRFVLAFAFLVPLGQGLNVGQVVLVKIAEQGSSLASNAWENAATIMRGSLAGLVAPRAPDLRPLTSRAVEIGMCRAIYRTAYAAFKDDAVKALGDMADFQKAPAERLTEERWSFGNVLQNDPALCGGYRFAAPASATLPRAEGQDTSSLATLGDAARAAAERLSLQANALGTRLGPAFLGSSSAVPDAEAAPAVAAFLREQQDLLENRLTALVRERNATEERYSASAIEKGWIVAGGVFLDTMSRQAVLGAFVDRAVPELDPPLLGHRFLNASEIARELSESAFFHAQGNLPREGLFAFYDKTGSAMKAARAWLYGTQIADPELIAATQLDLHDKLTEGSDTDRALALYRRVLDQGFARYGLFARAPHDAAPRSANVSLSKEMTDRPVAALAEMGRRANDLGLWAFALIGRGLSDPATMGAALPYGAVAVVLMLCGLVLMFVLPMVPFFRFIAGAMAWLLLVFEAIVSVPLVALVQMNPEGEGLFSSTARRAYCLWLAAFLRPFLIIFGFLVGWGGFFVGMLFVNALFAALTAPYAQIQIDSITGLRVVFVVLYTLLAFVVTNVAFKGISFFPERVTEWLGGVVMGHVDAVVAASGGAAGASGPSEIFVHGPVPGGESASAHASSTATSEGHEGAAGRSAYEKNHLSRDNALFPQVREKEIPAPPVPKIGETQTSVRTEPGSGAMAGARVGREGQGPSAVAIAKASVIIRPKDDDSFAKSLEDAKQVVKELRGEDTVKPTKEAAQKEEGEKPTESAAQQKTTED